MAAPGLTVRDIVVLAQNSFTPTLLMTGGGPYYSTLLMPLLVFEEAFDRWRFGDAAAIMVLAYVAIAALLFLGYRTVRGRIYDSET